MGIQSDKVLEKAYTLLEEGNPHQAKQILADAVGYNFGNSEINFAVWCCSYWGDFIENLPKMEVYERGEGLIARWKSFRTDCEHQKDFFQRTLYAMQKGVFTLALSSYSVPEGERNSVQKADILRKKGLCCKKLGKYEEALHFLTEANQISPSSPAVLSEMADCFALCGEERKAKVLFREAFFIDAQHVELSFLDSELICCLIRQVKEKGYSGNAIQEWIPVYGVLYGVFNIKRELRTLEVGRLKQEIYAKENELKDPANDAKILVPKIINMYFWLIDHYVRVNESTDKINECLLQIRIHDENIYRMYTR